MSSIDIFPWNDNFRTGIAEIDEQHKRLVDLVNRLANAVVFRSEQASPAALVDALAEYTRYHFTTEENIWHRVMPDDPLELNHIDSHRRFVEKIVELRARLGGDPHAVLVDALTFLTSWLISHILQSDKYLAMVVQAVDNGMPLPQAITHAREQSIAANHAIVNIVLALYSKFSGNAVRLMQEVAAREVSTRAQLESETQLQGVIDSTDDLIWSVDVNRFHLTRFNEGFASFARNYLGVGLAVGMSAEDVFRQDHVAEAMHAWYRECLSLGEVQVDEVVLTRDRLFAVTFHCLYHDGVPYGISAFGRDVTSQKRTLESIHQLAYYDPLTQLPNRRLLIDRLGQALSYASRTGSHCAVLFIDLDNFKNLNDTLGHQYGDELLVEVARRLREMLRQEDTVARLGGDEFVVLMPDTGATIEEAIVRTKNVAEKILAALRCKFNIGGEPYQSSASIGAFAFAGGEISIEELLKRADAAMYQAKNAGRNQMCFFDPEMQSLLEYRVRIERWMRDSLGKHFELHYQPQVDQAGKLIGVEALLRWMHPDSGSIPPSTFIPLAEESGLILQIGEWVLRSACGQIKHWENDPLTRGVPVAVNVSAKQFKQVDFVDLVVSTLRETGANPANLKLELTESMLVTDATAVARKMSELKALGLTLSLDDFGTGFSSLSVLKRLPFDQIKIDQSFVRELLSDPSDSAIATTIIALGHALGMSVIAEGVETEAQATHLANLGCIHYQGYRFGRPMTAGALFDWIGARASGDEASGA